MLCTLCRVDVCSPRAQVNNNQRDIFYDPLEFDIDRELKRPRLSGSHGFQSTHYFAN